MANKSILVTGAAGFVGSNVVRYLLQSGYIVHAVVRAGSDTWRLQNLNGSLYVHEGLLDNIATLSTTLTRIVPYGIFHLATYGSYPAQKNTTAVIEANILRFLYLLEASRSIPYKRLVVAGSSSEYGKKSKLMNENDVLEPNNLYAVAKAAATHLALLEYKVYNKPVCVLRLFNVYGPYEEKGRLVRSVIESCLQNTMIRLAKGNEARDLLYVDDVSKAFHTALVARSLIDGEIFNIGTGKQTTIKQVAQLVKQLTESKTTIKTGVYEGRTWDSQHWKASTVKAKKVLHWYHTVALQEGLKRTIQWYKTSSI